MIVKAQTMITYVYQTIPEAEGEEPETFEIRQSIHDAPLQEHPETGRPVRRLVSGGAALKTESRTLSRHGAAPKR